MHKQSVAFAAIAVLACLLPSGSATAQMDPCPDGIGLYFDMAAMGNHITTAAPFTQFAAYLCATNITADSGISGWECTVETVGPVTAASWAVGHGGTNFLTAPNFAVGIGTVAPAPYTPSIVLATLTGFILAPTDQVSFRVVAIPTPSIPGHNGAIYAVGNNAFDIRPLYSSGGTDTEGYPYVCAAINDPTFLDTFTLRTCGGPPAVAIDTLQVYTPAGEPDSPLAGQAVTVRGAVTSPQDLFAPGLFYLQDETGGIAVRGFSAQATLHQRLEIAGLVGSEGGEIVIDASAIFEFGGTQAIDPEYMAMAALNYGMIGRLLRVEGVVIGRSDDRVTLYGGGRSLPIVLAPGVGISPESLAIGAVHAVAGVLRNAAGELQLWPRFAADIGLVPPLPYDWTVTVDAVAGGLTDLGNLLGAVATASDGFDFYEDTPEPPHAPSNYLTAYFHHPEWGLPIGDAFSRDIREPYDLYYSRKVWPLVVQTDQIGPVTLSFLPNIPSADYDLVLEDHAAGVTIFLLPELSYTYQSTGPSPRAFSLHVGRFYEVPDLQPPQRDVPAGWSLIGMPLAPAAPGTAASVILDDVQGPAWLFRHAGAAGYAPHAPAEPLSRGQGYWLANLDAFTWTMEGVRDLNDIDVPLAAGWNLIGHPLWFPLPLGDVKVVRAGVAYPYAEAVALGLVAGNLFDWNNDARDYEMTVELTAWRGYWLAAYEPGLTLRLNYRYLYGAKRPLAKVGQPLAPAADNWAVALRLTDGAGRSSRAVLGVAPEARDGFDAVFDLPSPPASPQGPAARLAFNHPEWGVVTGPYFASDMRDPETRSQIWTAVISAPQAGPVTLAWDLSALPPKMDLQLYLPSQNRVVVPSLRAQPNLVLAVGAEPLVVQLRTPDHLTGVPAPGVETALRCVPNPFNPTTRIEFTAPRAGRAAIVIHDARGREVRRLDAGDVAAGSHMAVWDGRDAAGAEAASGLYVCRLHLDGVRVGGAGKMSLVR